MPSRNLRLLITEPEDFSARALAHLRTRFQVDAGPLSRAALRDELGRSDVVFVRLAHRFDEEMVSRSRSLAVIVSPTTGLNHIDLTAAAERGVTVLSLRGERAFLETIRATAELTWGLILALARRIPAASRYAAAGGWDRDRFKGIELSGRTLGVVGYGRLGARVAHYGQAFAMKVTACDPTANLPDGISRRDLDALCAEADIISIHVTSKPENVGLIGERQLALFKPTALLVNTSRGDIIDERALLAALREGRIAGAALDVLAAEYDSRANEIADQLRRYARENDTLLLTPHVGGATYDSMARTEEFMVERLFAAMDRGEIHFRTGSASRP
jgi:D-3-phosphoglycerate dehydrogenase